MNKVASSLLVSAGFALIAASTPVVAQDVLTVNARTVKLRLENQNVRVLEATLEPGAKEQPHSHPASIIYVITGGKFKSHAPDDKVSESVLKDGDVIYRDPLTHWAENTGDTTIHLIIVELKSPK